MLSGLTLTLKDKTLLKAKISALGCYTPPRVLTNKDLEKLVETNDQWIMERTGIRGAPHCRPGDGYLRHGD